MTKSQLAVLTVAMSALLGIALFKARQASEAEMRIQAATKTHRTLAKQLARLELTSNNDRPRRVRNDGLKEISPDGQLIDPARRDAFVRDLREKLAREPGRKIPEMNLLPDEEWRQTAGSGMEPGDPDAYAFARLRLRAKQLAAEKLASALDQYAKANNGTLPADVNQLAPFLPPTIDAAILARYKMSAGGKMEDYERDSIFIEEQGPPADPGNDSKMYVGGRGYWLADPVGRGPMSNSRPSGRITHD